MGTFNLNNCVRRATFVMPNGIEVTGIILGLSCGCKKEGGCKHLFYAQNRLAAIEYDSFTHKIESCNIIVDYVVMSELDNLI